MREAVMPELPLASLAGNEPSDGSQHDGNSHISKRERFLLSTAPSRKVVDAVCFGMKFCICDFVLDSPERNVEDVSGGVSTSGVSVDPDF